MAIKKIFIDIKFHTKPIKHTTYIALVITREQIFRFTQICIEFMQIDSD